MTVIQTEKKIFVCYNLFSRSKRHYDVKKAEYDAEVNTAKAEADLAYDLKVRLYSVFAVFEVVLYCQFIRPSTSCILYGYSCLSCFSCIS